MIGYKGYLASVEFDDSVGRLHGRVINSGPYPIVTFEATDVEGIRAEFQRSIDERRRVRSGFADPEPGELSCILKFDGVAAGAMQAARGEPQPFNRVEAAYAHMALGAALDVVEVQLLESEEGHAHLLVARFDREGDRRLHQHTLGGLLHLDYNLPGASSYEEYLRTILRLGMPHAAVVEGFRRMVFNVYAVNQDDHVKNLSFHMNETGKWSLTPAYDLTFAKGSGFTAEHQMRVADKTIGITRGDLLEVATRFGIRAPKSILDEVEDAVGEWPRYSSQTGVPQEAMAAVEQELAARRQQLRH